ncbi:MAG: Unknown protein, partial [uncultured Campylobacterales bacterium]
MNFLYDCILVLFLVYVPTSTPSIDPQLTSRASLYGTNPLKLSEAKAVLELNIKKKSIKVAQVFKSYFKIELKNGIRIRPPPIPKLIAIQAVTNPAIINIYGLVCLSFGEISVCLFLYTLMIASNINPKNEYSNIYVGVKLTITP